MHNRLLITGANSGCGKTTVTLALLAALKRQHHPLISFKCGPDYIDPMFHREILGLPCFNLDLFLTSPAYIRNSIAAQADKLSIIEGVMGFYDGIGVDGACSTYEIAKVTNTPTIFVINAKGLYTSAGAILQGFASFKSQNQISGVIFNNVSAMVYQGLAKIATAVGITPLGYLPPAKCANFTSRQLGLITATEITDLHDRLNQLGEIAAETLELEKILALATTAAPLTHVAQHHKSLGSVRIGVARDHAFCFIYEENLQLLRELGAELCYFSPLTDSDLPDNISALYLPGGYPELYLNELSNNERLRHNLRQKTTNGLPTWAECGGFMYLHHTIDDHPMVGVIDSAATKTNKLQRFGYATLHAKQDNLFCQKDEQIPIHEFHYYTSDTYGDSFIAQKPSGISHTCIHATPTLFAGFPHLYLPSNPAFATNFIQKALTYANSRHA